MRSVSAAVGLMLVMALALGSSCCVPQEKYDALKLRNAQQEQIISDKQGEVIRLQERLGAMQAQVADCQRLLQERSALLENVSGERDAVRNAFNELIDKMKQMQAQPIIMGGAGLPQETTIAIRKLAADYPNLFQFDEENGLLRFASDVTFDSGSYMVKPDARSALGELAKILTASVAEEITVTVVGYTDNVPVKKATTIAALKEAGVAPNNQGLSQARAQSVASVLTSAGVSAGRIKTEGRGESQPIAPNTTTDGRAQNRRVEIYLR